MNPRSKKYLIEETLKRTGLDELKTNAILSYYWQHIRDFLQTPHDTSIFLNKLGTFSLSPFFIERYIEDKELYLQRMNKLVMEGKQMNKWQSDYYIRSQNDLVWLKKRREDMKNKKAKVKSKKLVRDEYIKQNPAEIAEDMEQQDEDTPGAMEAAIQRWQDRENS